MSRKQQNQASKDVEPKTELSAIDGPSASSAAAPPVKEVESSASVGDIETNRTHLCHTVSVPMSDIEGAVKAEMEKRCQAISAEFTELLQKLQGVVDKRFVVMKSKDVWFDRDVAALYPRLDKHDMPTYQCRGQQEVRKFTGYEQDGYTFVMMSPAECGKTFCKGNGNPCLDDNGCLKNGGNASRIDYVITEDFVRGGKSDCSRWYFTNGNGHTGDDCGRGCSSTANLIPIYRLKGKNASPMTFAESILAWMKEGLVPEELSKDLQALYNKFMAAYESLAPYIKKHKDSLYINQTAFMQDVQSGTMTATVFDYSFNFRQHVEAIAKMEEICPSADTLKQRLLECDWKRANIAPYVEKQLTDINLGHWELFEDMVAPNTADTKVKLPEQEPFVARPPQLDVHLSGTCGIDFGTKSTVVVCLQQDKRMLRVGKGDYSKEPTMADYENPTVIELRDIDGFRKAYAARTGRPYTEWEQMTVSHQAAEAIFQSEDDSSVYYSVFSELKQWANDKKRRLMLRDRQGHTVELKPYLELGDADFDPIEAYAYYLGLYINNMHNGIYIDYILSFPVNYAQEVRERIRLSFERGLRKSLPPALLQDEEMMEQFNVYAGASEPAAYAISALQEFGLEPQEDGDVVYYGVFDFGGGTTDFDFGLERIPANHRWKFEIEQFGKGGDPYLGGENILDLLAYEVYQDNLSTMREHQIPFVLPPRCQRFAGSETLVFERHDASQQAFMNSKRLASLLRPIWERHTGYREKYDQGNTAIHLFSAKSGDAGNLVEVTLKIDVARMESCIEKRIRDGVENFFTKLKGAFVGKEPMCIHIFLAGNSCKSPVVQQLFEEAISKISKDIADNILISKMKATDTSRCFILHLPLGMSQPAADSAETAADGSPSTVVEEPAAEETRMDYDRVLTGKTGVAFGLLRSRIGGKDVKIIDNNKENGEITFPFYLGEIDRSGHFHVVIGHDSGYGKWVRFTYGDERVFELYYTLEPQAMEGTMAACEVSKVRCRLTPDEISDEEDVFVYIRKVKPDCIEYAVGKEADFTAGEVTKKIHSLQLNQ